MSLNKDAVEKYLDYIKEAISTNSQEFIIAFFLYEINGIKKEEITDDMINSVDSILEDKEYYYDEQLRDRISNIKIEMLNDKLRDSLNNYIDKCTPEEWEKLISDYNIMDTENYMGEVRESLEEAVVEEFEVADEEQQEGLLKFFSKYDVIEKEQEEELER